MEKDPDCKSIEDGCMPTNRMINALVFYSTLKIDINEEISDTKSNDTELIDREFKSTNKSQNIKRTDKEKFIKYINETYTQFLNDYIHLIDKHLNDIKNISEIMAKDFSLTN